MEKQQNMNCDDSMTTVTMKDYTPGLEYPDPPPSYRTMGGKTPQLVQVAKIVAVAAVAIAGMLSFALVFSAWLTSSNNANCQYLQQASIESILQPQSLRSGLLDDLDSAESKLESSKKNEKTMAKPTKESSEEAESGEDLSILKLPLELNLHEHMFEKNQRSHMNCVIEKKKAEEIVDEQSKPLPPFLGLLNMSTDPRYLHFTGEKMAISCDSGNDHRQHPQLPTHHAPHPGLPLFMDMLQAPAHHAQASHPFPSLTAPDSAHLPLQIIGPIPLPAHSADLLAQHSGFSAPSGPQMIPIIVPDNQHQQSQQQYHHGLPSLSIEDLGPIFFQQGNQLQGPPPPTHFQIPPQPFNVHRQPYHHQSMSQSQQQVPLSAQSSEIRERGLHQPIPIVPRHHIQHIIRPRSIDAVEKPEASRVKRCACDCACKNHEA